ncbi:MAG: beta-ketoacyl-ACP synthase I, partial [Parvularculaceae bacterium]|nr:beta-ketoacyl-ACP synthase I [Parvularculaceae bacterium]
MRRVAITGVGVVSSIGDDAAEVLESLKTGRSGLSRSKEFEELGFKAQVVGRPKLNVEEALDRRTRRFMGEASAWNYVAMKQAIADSRLDPGEISHPKTGIIMGSGGPSTRVIVEAADITRRDKGNRKIGPTAVPKAMSSTASATLAVPFEI